MATFGVQPYGDVLDTAKVEAAVGDRVIYHAGSITAPAEVDAARFVGYIVGVHPETYEENAQPLVWIVGWHPGDSMAVGPPVDVELLEDLAKVVSA